VSQSFGDSKGVLGVALFLGEPRVRFAESLVEVLSLSSHLPKVEEGVVMLYSVALYDCWGPEGWSGGRPCYGIQSPFSLDDVRDVGLAGPGVATGLPVVPLLAELLG
jgi:hypothetical protein